jgi:hypothetical protein
MSDALRGLVLLVSLVLWLPVLRPVLAGGMTTAEAGIRYAVALLLAWSGVSLLSALVRSYSTDTETGTGGEAQSSDPRPRRRQEDPAD